MFLIFFYIIMLRMYVLYGSDEDAELPEDDIGGAMHAEDEDDSSDDNSDSSSNSDQDSDSFGSD